MTASQSIPLGKYVFERVRQLGISKIFGVPGDYNLKLLDYCYEVPHLEWVGTCNELNGAYAADGFARITHKPGVLVTTYAVGELSALNGIAGAFAENVPIIHIVGMSARFQQDSGALIHHGPPTDGLKPGDHKIYTEVTSRFGCGYELLYNLEAAPAQIDRLLEEVVRTKQPGTLYIPADMAVLPVDGAPLNIQLAPSAPVHPSTELVVTKVLEAIEHADTKAIVSDLYVDRWSLKPVVEKLLEKTGAWGFTTIAGKSTIDEEHPQFVGVYNGEVSEPGIANAVDSSDLVIDVGPNNSDSNTGGFSRNILEKKRIALHPRYAIVFGEAFDGVHFEHVLNGVVKRLEHVVKKQLQLNLVKPSVSLAGNLNQKMLAQFVSKCINPGDTLIIESGTVQFASVAIQLPSKTNFYTQVFYSSIGFALPAAVGSAIAMKGAGGKVVLVEGDGSAQMTIQEMGTIVRHDLPVTILLINNDGYSIERAIWGPEQGYNDICPNWNWTMLLKAFGGRDGKFRNYQVHTAEQFLSLTQSPDFTNYMHPQLVEVFVPKYDYPVELKESLKRTAAHNGQRNEAYRAKHDLVVE